jgi:O-antigen ligase
LIFSDKNIIRLYHYELIAFAFLLPIYRKVIPYAIALIVITWFFEGDFLSKVTRVVNSRHRLYTLLFAAIYVVYAIGLLYTENLGIGFFDMEVKLSLFIFPVIFSSIRSDVLSAANARRVLWAFIFGSLASMLLCYSVALADYLRTGSMAAFYYSRLSVLIHPSYLAMYVSFSITALLYFLYRGYITGRVRQWLSVLLIAMFGFFVVMLSSKAGILGLAFLIALFSAYLIIAERKVLKGLLTGAVMAFLFLFLLMLFPASSARFEQTRTALQQADIAADEIANSSGERIMIWWYSFEITNEHFLAGVGTGDVKANMLEKYREKEMPNALRLELNAHNQYLQTMLALGVIGLVVLMLSLVLPALYSIEHRHYLYLAFLFLAGFNFLFESMLETQAGVVFYAFFNAYLFAIKKDPASGETGS